MVVMHLKDSRVRHVSAIVIRRVTAVKTVAVLQLEVVGWPKLIAILKLVLAAHHQKLFIGVHALVLWQGHAEVEIVGAPSQPVEVRVGPCSIALEASFVGCCHSGLFRRDSAKFKITNYQIK